jgi:hypothetical protein
MFSMSPAGNVRAREWCAALISRVRGEQRVSDP